VVDGGGADSMLYFDLRGGRCDKVLLEDEVEAASSSSLHDKKA
jgi:hypothetical protein